MKASKAIKIAHQIVGCVSSYAEVAQRWDIEAEDDYQEFVDAVIDIIHEEGEENG